MRFALLVPLVLLVAATPAVAEQDQATLEPRRIQLQAHPAATSIPLAALPRGRSDYRIGRQDLLEIEVFGVEQLSQTVRVADDGSITMPLLGRLDVAGRTKSDLQDAIARSLRDGFVRNPQVTVFVREYVSKRVAVTGAVKSPGSFEMLGRKTLLEMLSLAGGLAGDLGKEIVIFRRQENGATRRIAVELEPLIYHADPALNVTIEAGDIVYVPTVERVRIFVSGAVRNPDLYEVPREEPVTVLKAITLAGGTTDRAAQKRVQVIRTDSDGTRITLEVNLKRIKRGKAEDPILQKDDVVLVPESFF